ncbi:hypothetical protein ISF_05820 [Cordyceps fumosorosea ARSEF 2679]|uniref:DUF7053 domain-containing protein n=1 Tax=Cordyceps fumosorosea (strain ARSEF 2679) TaxID=1081104 RepID=A0A167TNI0_CORFA|nr:hypothetical protein ISF_05820 [Cordyceps fumosorosea ARSEF 2679]OAA60781.1 hypothetical protein ISF_05820 [Cordyceps fumosorosea ARSEF 2679]
MPKQSTFTTVTPLPAGMTRQAAIDFLQDHEAMIDLNPLVTDRRRLPSAPPSAPADEHRCAWYEVTDRIAYLPGGLASGSVRYRCAFLDLAGIGLQTHCYAPMGVDLRTRWSVGGSEPGEPREPRELGLHGDGDGARLLPPDGLYLREDTELRCGVVMTAFVKRTLRCSHRKLAERLAQRASERARSRGRGEEQDEKKQDEERQRRDDVGEHGGGRRGVGSYYVQRELEARRRAAAAAATVGYPRNVVNGPGSQRIDQGCVSEEKQLYAGGTSNYCGQQHRHQTQRQYHEAGARHDASELP